MLPAPNSRLLLTLAITAAMAAFAASVACSDASSPSIDSMVTNATLDSTVASCDPLAQPNIAPCESEVDDSKEFSPYLDSLTTNSYLVATVEPCAQLTEFDVDPCERRFDDWDVVQTPYNTGHPHRRERGPHTVETSVTLAFNRSYHIPHMTVRGTLLPGSTRCQEQNTRLFGGFSEEPNAMEWAGDACFSELRVKEYIVGSGPPLLTIQVGWHHKILDYGDSSGDRYYEWVEGIHSVYEGSEWVVSLHVPLDFVYSVWDTRQTWWWDVQRRDDGTIVVVDYQARYRSQLPREENGYEVTLDEFRTTARQLHAEYLLANGGRIGDFEGAPRIVNDANYEFLHKHMSRGPVFSIVDATPRAAPPPPS